MILAGLLRDPVLLRCASWCQMQRAPRGKLLNSVRLSAESRVRVHLSPPESMTYEWTDLPLSHALVQDGPEKGHVPIGGGFAATSSTRHTLAAVTAALAAQQAEVDEFAEWSHKGSARIRTAISMFFHQ